MQDIMQEKSPIKKRILHFLDYKDISKYKFYQETGITRGILNQDNGISEENTAKFLAYYNEISLNWLFKGEGPMLRSDADRDMSYPVAEEDSSSIVAESGYSESTHSNTQLIRLQGQIDLLRDQLREKDAIIQELRIKLERGK